MPCTNFHEKFKASREYALSHGYIIAIQMVSQGLAMLVNCFKCGSTVSVPLQSMSIGDFVILQVRASTKWGTDEPTLEIKAGVPVTPIAELSPSSNIEVESPRNHDTSPEDCTVNH